MRRILGIAVLVIAIGAAGAPGRLTTADEGNVEERIAQFWLRINAMQPSDYLSSADLGQWALNVIDRDARARLTVADFRTATATMQSALDRAGPAPVIVPVAPTPTPTPAVFTFGAGKKIVPTEVPPGTYRTRTSAPGCYWERLSGLGGTFGEIIANDNTDGPAVVTIGTGDKGFDSTRCALWSIDLSPITSSRTAPFGAGTYMVGVDIDAGTWRSTGGTSCYWQRTSGFTGSFGEIIANDNAGDTTVVTIASSDKGFTSTRCGTWTKIG